jgi:DNA-binding transcriptional MocR family regulator
VAGPGDVIAVESPTFYAMLHAIERMGMKAVEVTTHPQHGIDVEALAAIAQAERIAACMVMPNFQNPLGFKMPDERKRQLVDFAARSGMPLIENGVYDELHYGDAPPSTLKSYDRDGLVLHCSSFSKTLTSAHRIGWALPGRYRDQVEKLKLLNTLTTPSLPQIAIATFLERDDYASSRPARAPRTRPAATCCGSSCRRRSTPCSSTGWRWSAASPSAPATCSRPAAATATSSA